MVQHIKNDTGISLAMSVWLAYDEYDNGADVAPEGELISATTLLKPTRQFVLSNQLPENLGVPDITDRIASRLGQAIHASVEDAWRSHYEDAMTNLGMPKKLIDRIRINPETVEPETLPVYLEQRFFRSIEGVVISGQFDQIIDGELNDVKTTSVFGYLNGTNTENYRNQMSIYRWINPEKVTSNIGRIQHVFTDWQRMMTFQNPHYPKHRVTETEIELMSLAETERFIKAKLAEIRANVSLNQDQMIRCTDKELWKSEPQYKYYAKPENADKGGRATKNFTSKQDALIHLTNAGKGKIVDKPGEVKACKYCPAFEVCTQKDEYFQ
jgi:hypothetical protein